jgi:hypothetical protein
LNRDEWLEGNERYLAASLAWLRLRLERLASREQANARPTSEVCPALHSPELVPSKSVSPESVPSEHLPRSFWQRFLGSTSAAAEQPADLVDDVSVIASDATWDKHANQADEAVAAAEAIDPPPALVILGQRLGLSKFEQDVLLLCASMEMDAKIPFLCSRAQGDPGHSYPTFALATVLFDEPAWDAISPVRPLRYWHLIEINQPPDRPLITSMLRADERIVNYLKGLNYLDDRLASMLIPLNCSDGHRDLPKSQKAYVDAILHHLQQPNHMPLVQMLGRDGPTKQMIAWYVAAELGLSLYSLPIQFLPSQSADLDALAKLWQRESLLLPVALYIDAHEIDSANPKEGSISLLNRFAAISNSILFLDTSEIWTGLGSTSISIEIYKPTPSEQQAAWEEVLGDAAGNSPALLAGQFDLNLAAIYRIALEALSDSREEGQNLLDCIWDACLVSTRPRLDVLAKRIDTKATWNGIVLPKERVDLLHQIAGQARLRSKVYDEWGFREVMNRGMGLSVLFAGESGTGKTMAAEVLANELQLNLYRIDLSGVVSKYIGETEKNLRRVFDAAEDGGAILLFDEADALFGKRSEVKDSHDRYANIEINYLLQRIEAYRGLAILATNMKSALDAAFLRRLRFIVDFPFPGLDERKRIWQKVFPPKVTTEGLDYDRLARFNLTGGSIFNISLSASFLAAARGTPVTMPLVLEAAKTELRKLERPINEAEFRWPPGGR